MAAAGRAIPRNHAADGPRSRTNYPGANAQVVADTVAVPIEEQVNGVEGMLYMSSTSSSDGSYSLTVTFEIGTNLDLAQVLVQNRVAMAEPTLPEEVRRQGITVRKQSPNIVMAITLTLAETDVRQPVSGQLCHAARSATS